MKKYLTLLMLLFCVKSAMADTVIISSATPSQPLLVHDDASIEREFQNVYQQIARISSSTVSSIASLSGSGKLKQVVQGTTSSGFTTTSNAYGSTSLTATIVVQSASDFVFIIAFGDIGIADNNNIAYADLFRGSTLLGSTDRCQLDLNSTATLTTMIAPCTMSFLDSPGAAGSTVYTVKLRSNNVGQQASWSGAIDQSIVLMEIAP